MIERKAAAKLIKRLSGLDYFPTLREAMDELIDALVTAQTPEQATVAVDDWLAANREAPKPSDLRAALKAQEPREYSAEAQYGPRPVIQCQRCTDLGWYADGESGLVVLCWCEAGKGAEVAAMVAKLNQRFIGGRREAKAAGERSTP